MIGLIIMGLLVFEPFRTEPPSPAVMVSNTKVSTTQGSYCWSGILSTKCVEQILPKKHAPTPVSPGEEVTIDFRTSPIAQSLKVEQWIDEDHVHPIKMKDNALVAPTEKGVYVYYVTANWNKGDGHYAFSIVVQ